MASVTYGKFIYGLRDLKVTNAAGSTQEDLDASQTCELEPQYEVAEFMGDDSLKAVLSRITHGKGKISAGAISSAALAIMTGVTLSTTSSSPTEVTEFQLDANQNLPYFKIYGQSYDEDSGDVHLLMHKVKLNSGLKVTLQNGQILMSEAEFLAVDNGTNGVMELIQHETATAVPSS